MKLFTWENAANRLVINCINQLVTTVYVKLLIYVGDMRPHRVHRQVHLRGDSGNALAAHKVFQKLLLTLRQTMPSSHLPKTFKRPIRGSLSPQASKVFARRDKCNDDEHIRDAQNDISKMPWCDELSNIRSGHANKKASIRHRHPKCIGFCRRNVTFAAD